MHEELIPRTDIKISKIGFGCAHLGSKTKWQRRAESENLIAVALSLGITLFDTSAIYAQGESERILGRVLRQSAEGKRAVVITKIGYVPLPSNLAGQVAIKAFRKARRSLGLITQNPQRFDVRFLERAVDQSLMRLQRERIDVLFLHCPSLFRLLFFCSKLSTTKNKGNPLLARRGYIVLSGLSKYVITGLSNPTLSYWVL